MLLSTAAWWQRVTCLGDVRRMRKVGATQMSRATHTVPSVRRFATALSGVILLLAGCAQESTQGGQPTETPTMGIRRLPVTGSLTIEGGPLDGQHDVGPDAGQHKMLPGGCSTTDLGRGRELQILGHFSVEDSLVTFMFFAPYGSGEELRARQFRVWGNMPGGGYDEFKGEASLAIDIGPEVPRGAREHLTIQLDARAGPMRISGDINCIDDGPYPHPTPSPSPHDGRSTDEPLA